MPDASVLLQAIKITEYTGTHVLDFLKDLNFNRLSCASRIQSHFLT